VRPEVRKEVLELLTLMLAPMTPHLAEELWEMMGHTGGLWKAIWPSFNQELARDDEVEIPVQVNGRVRGKIKVATGSAESDVVRIALALPAVAQHVNGKRVVKQIYVPNKMLNLVVA
jgi:leucyl-tRNA synthetase